MKLTIEERGARAERAYRDQAQRELDAFIEGKEAGRLGVAAGACPEYSSRGEQDAWQDGRRAVEAERLRRYAAVTMGQVVR